MATALGKSEPSLVAHEQRISDLEVDVCRHEVFIVGNGVTGAKTEIALLKQSLVDFNQKVEEIKRSMGKVALALWGIAGSVIAAIIIWLITEYFPSHM